MTIDYKPLMTSKEIPWHNPHELTPEQVDPFSAGWRLFLKEELDGRFQTPEMLPIGSVQFFNGDANEWGKTSVAADREGWTYRTREPLPEKYRHLVEPEIPAGLPPLPEPPVGHRWVARGFGFFAKGGHYVYMTPGHRNWVTDRIAGGAKNLFYVEAVKIKQPAKDPKPDSDAHKLAVLMAQYRGDKTQFLARNGNWRDEMSIEGVFQSLEGGIQVRIAPKPAPVKVPLSDYRVSEAIRFPDNEIYIIKGFNINGAHNEVEVESCTHPTFFTFDYLAEHAKIHRNGTWQDCFTLAD